MPETCSSDDETIDEELQFGVILVTLVNDSMEGQTREEWVKSKGKYHEDCIYGHLRSIEGMQELRKAADEAPHIAIAQVNRVPTALSNLMPARMPNPMQNRDNGEA